MAKRVPASRKRDDGSLMTRTVNSVFRFVRFAEFEILFVLFFVIAFLIFKDLYSIKLNSILAIVCALLTMTIGLLTSRPEYNQILVKKPGGPDWWVN